jgi:hypothetical protein
MYQQSQKAEGGKVEGRRQKPEGQKAGSERQTDFPFVICHLSFGTAVKCIGGH